MHPYFIRLSVYLKNSELFSNQALIYKDCYKTMTKIIISHLVTQKSMFYKISSKSVRKKMQLMLKFDNHSFSWISRNFWSLQLWLFLFLIIQFFLDCLLIKCLQYGFLDFILSYINNNHPFESRFFHEKLTKTNRWIHSSWIFSKPTYKKTNKRNRYEKRSKENHPTLIR